MSASHPTGTAPMDLSTRRVSVVTSVGRAAFPDGLRSSGSFGGMTQLCPRQVVSPEAEISAAMVHPHPNREDLRAPRRILSRFATLITVPAPDQVRVVGAYARESDPYR